MLAPSIYTDFVSDLFNGFGELFREPALFDSHDNVFGISTDVQEFEDQYKMDMELPGYKKEDIHVSLKDGYLKISAEKQQEVKEESKFLRQEHYYGKVSRSFFVGKEVKKDQIEASYENGILTLNIPKVKPEPAVEEDNNISIK